MSGHPTVGIEVGIAARLHPLRQEGSLPAKGQQVGSPSRKGAAIRRLDRSDSLLGKRGFNRLHG